MQIVIVKPPGVKVNSESFAKIYDELQRRGYHKVVGHTGNNNALLTRSLFHNNNDMETFLRKSTGDSKRGAALMFSSRDLQKYYLPYGAVCIDGVDMASAKMLNTIATQDPPPPLQGIITTLESLVPSPIGCIISKEGEVFFINKEDGFEVDGLWMSEDLTTTSSKTTPPFKEDFLCNTCNKKVYSEMEKEFNLCAKCFDKEWIEASDEYRSTKEDDIPVGWKKEGNVYTPIGFNTDPPAKDIFLSAKCKLINYNGN